MKLTLLSDGIIAELTTSINLWMAQELHSLGEGFFSHFWNAVKFNACSFLCSYLFGFFGHEECGVLAPQLGIKPTPFAWKAKSQPLDCQESPKTEDILNDGFDRTTSIHSVI